MAIATGAFVLALGAPASAPCHIGSFVGAPYTVKEGAGTVTITYSNGAGAQPGGSVDYATVEGTATSAKDYTATSGTLTWGGVQAAGVGVNPAQRSFSVPILQDVADEPNETFTIRMSHFTGCFDAGSSDKTAIVAIKDDDEPPTPQQETPDSTLAATPSVPEGRTPDTPASTPSLKTSPTSSTTPAGAPTAVAVSDRESGGGLSGAAVGGIVGAAVVLCGIGVFVARRGRAAPRP